MATHTLTPPRSMPAQAMLDMARSLPRDYGASFRKSLKDSYRELRALPMSPVPPNIPLGHSSSFRERLGGSWDQLETGQNLESSKHQLLRASWDQLDTRSRDNTVDMRNHSLNRRETSSRRDSSHRSHRDHSSSRRDNSLSRRDASSNRRDTSLSRRDSTLSRRDTSSSRRDGSQTRRDSSIGRRDGTLSRRDNSLTRRDTSLTRKDNLSSYDDLAQPLYHGMDSLLSHTLCRPHHHRKNEHTPPKEDKVEGESDRNLTTELASRLPTELASPRDSVAGVKGLLNEPGQNNCFINSAVQ
ncbi:unnamed protein product, partial [Meganyctiphanes norvegica]